MTLKDQFDIQGYDSTLGYVGRAFKPAAEESVLVTMLKQMGAIVIGKSNLPQSIMVFNPHRYMAVHLSSPRGSGVKPRIHSGD
jgi:Asp-tRNA(Asn)/Glu-tRNA(Gln) amidotransferase A subunit family amidase